MWRNNYCNHDQRLALFVNGGKAMAADNTSRAAVLRTMLFGMVIYFGYSPAFQNTEELKYQITQEVNASRSIISNDRWKSVIANSEATLNWLVHDYKLIDYLNTILIPDTKNQPEVLTLLLKKFTSINYTMAKNIPLLLYQSIFRWNLIPGVANRFSALSICHASRWNVPVEIEEVRIW